MNKPFIYLPFSVGALWSLIAVISVTTPIASSINIGVQKCGIIGTLVGLGVGSCIAIINFICIAVCSKNILDEKSKKLYPIMLFFWWVLTFISSFIGRIITRCVLN